MNRKSISRLMTFATLAVSAGTGLALTPTTAFAATNCGGSGGLYPDDCYYRVHLGGAHHSGDVYYNAGWDGRILVQDSASDGGACTYLQTRTKRNDGTWTSWTNEPAVCGGRSAYLRPYAFHNGDVQLRLSVPTIGTGATVTCVRGSDGSELCR